MTMRSTATRTDGDLIRSAAQGNRPAFAALARRYEQTVYSFAYKICRDRGKAREVLQDTLINVFKKLDGFDGKSKFSTWLYTIVVNNCMMKRRRRKMDDLLESLDEPPAGTGDGRMRHLAQWVETPADQLLNRELQTVLDSALRKLPVDYRAVFALRDMEGKSTEETAMILNISREATKSRLRRARAFLREELDPYMTSGKG
jgi:RNA polymerase sigma-70 factor (ECF subfamily)